MQMHEMNGGDLILRIRQDRPDQPIIIASAFADELRASAEPSKRANFYLQKPFSIKALREAITEVTGNR